MGSPRCPEAVIGLTVVLWLAAMASAAPPFETVEGLFDASRPRTLGLSVLKFRETVLYRATETTFRFCHHPNLVQRGKRVWCMWSNGRVGEDEPGQRILYSTARVGALDRWSTPRELAKDPSGRGACVASGWIVAGKTLVAFYTITGGTNFDPKTALWARTSTDGRT